MSVEDRVVTLRDRHEALEKRLKREQARPMPDADTVRTLKHEKLTLKDEIRRIQDGA